MKMNEIRAKAKALGINSMKKTKETVVREIQRAEGNRDCFSRGEKERCGQARCAWREGCK